MHQQQMSAVRLKGVFAAALTPMDEDLRINHEAFGAHCRWLLDAGCHGLGVFGTTGEANSLAAGERISALESLVDFGIPGDKLLPGTGSCALTETVELSRAALETGVAGVLVLPPFYYKGVSDDGIFAFFAELVERVSDERLRVYLYHFPQMTGVGFGPPLIERLVEAYPGVIHGIKDSEGNWPRIEALCHQFADFEVFAGTERYLLDTLQNGGAGCISASANVTAGLARRVYDLHQAGREEEAREAQESLTELRAEIEALPMIPVLKSLMHQFTGEDHWHHLRPPLCTLHGDQSANLAEHLRAAGVEA
jgi:4-hydroxy-tetrahydrodipicolinate synthase